jgi:hypothetical protein
VDDQVLTAAKLNEFIEYFDEQDRLSRVCLSGVGIACGFKVEYVDVIPAITIYQGCGITTDGDLLKLQEPTPVDSEGDETSTGDSFKDINQMVESLTFTNFKIFLDEEAGYAPFINGASVINLLELVTEEDATTDSDAIPFTPASLDNKVVVLYLECYAKDADICTSTNCDNQGRPNIQNVKVLLVDKGDVENFVNTNDTVFNKHNIYETILTLPSTAVEKVILNSSGSSLNNVSNYAELSAEYKSKITSAKNLLNTAYSGFLHGFSEILDIPNSVINPILNQIDDLDNFVNNNRIQYRYDRTRDLSDTYNEIARLLLKLKAECCPNIDSFSKHLLLGRLEAVPTKVYPELRHEFYHSPVNNDYHSIIKQVKSLIKRVQNILNNFDLNNAESIEITPSRNCSDLGEKAIPVYYNVDLPFLTHWDFLKALNYKQGNNLSYHKDNLTSGGWVQNPLNFELDCTDLYRIEGQFGHPGLASRDAINSKKAATGLDFDCLIFDIIIDAANFSAFVKDHPSITHKAGVDKGGTFILLTNNETVVADFSLSYKIAPASDEQGCCSLMECTYPWISSLKYMNNLSRSLKGTQSRNRPMPQTYVLQVIEYKINGQALINNTTTLSIPLGQIFLRRVHAVTEALNNRFSSGVVFDFNESQKRLVITRAKDDTFTIRLREISMANNNPIYTYSNTGMFRNNKVFRLDAMRCRDLKGFNAAFYQKLQAKIAPVNKDDDYGLYDEKWRKWSRLTEKLITNPFILEAGLTRMVTTASQLPQEIQITIGQIKSAFSEVAGTPVPIEYRLDGDWVNGIWVNRFMLDHYRQNSKNTHDDIVLFINLRKYLHNETGVTKLSIYLSNIDYKPEFNAAIDMFKAVADIYFGAPSGATTIPI